MQTDEKNVLIFDLGGGLEHPRRGINGVIKITAAASDIQISLLGGSMFQSLE
ncbi:hypothetical protein U1Q18_046365, partial [Sarracenia purpurea var. burkii]